jgi:hypothetical protein
VTLPRVAVEALAAHLEEYADPEPDGRYSPPPGARTCCAVPSTGSCLAAAAGGTTKELMERMGHTSPAVALRYQHVMVDRQGQLASALDDLARAATAPAKGTARARKGTQRARRR